MIEKIKQSKIAKISLWALLAVLVLFVVITSSVIKSQKDRLDYLKQENAEMEKVLGEEETSKN